MQTLSANEIRVIGCLIEKSVTTPDNYPLTLSALTNACNQKSSRDPVMALEQGTVQHAARDLAKRQLVRIEENFKRGVEKYSHRFYASKYDSYQFDKAQAAVICLLLLRGAQTPGELRTRSGRLHSFEDNSAVVQTLASLMAEDREPLVVKLPRIPGRKDSEYMHLFAGPVDVEAYAAQVRDAHPAAKKQENPVIELTQRVEALEAEVAKLKEILATR